VEIIPHFLELGGICSVYSIVRRQEVITMNWDAVGAIAELLGAIVVMTTLVYLTLQVRQYSVGMSSATFHSSMLGFNQIKSMLVQDPTLAFTYEKGMNDPDSLSPEQQAQVVWLMRCYVNIFENLYQQFVRGACPEEYWIRYARELKQTLDSPGGMLFRSANTTYVELYAYVDEMSDFEGSAYEFALSLKDPGDA
jgi:hypothetical protein